MGLKTKRFSLILLIPLLMVSCYSVYNTINNRNFADNYNPRKNHLHAFFEVYQSAPNKLDLYFKVFPIEFLFERSKADSVPSANISIAFRVTENYKSIKIVDSLTQNYVFRGKPRPVFLGNLPIHLPDDNQYVLEVFLTDKKSGKSISQIIHIQQDSRGLADSYMLLSKYAVSTFKPYVTVNDSFRVKCTLKSSPELQITRLTMKQKPAIPPDIILTGDENYSLDYDTIINYPQMDTTLISLKKEGVYILKNSSLKLPKAVCDVNQFYPYVKTPIQLLKSIAYICTEKELEQLEKLGNPKQAVDTFWQNITPDLNKARELIRVYYNRVQLANYFFTENAKEGWLTDRGMIYIIFGNPNFVNKDDEGETWIYGQNIQIGLNFYFYRNSHPVLGEYFELNRSDRYARIWFNAISTWRSGKVFSIN